MSGASEVPAIPEDVRGLAHELWAMAQCGPHEGIEDAVERMAALLTARPVDTGREKALEEAATLVQTMVAFPSRRGGRVVIGRDAEDAIADAIRALANPENGRG